MDNRVNFLQSVRLQLTYSPFGHMVAASDFIFGIHMDLLPHVCLSKDVCSDVGILFFHIYDGYLWIHCWGYRVLAHTCTLSDLQVHVEGGQCAYIWHHTHIDYLYQQGKFGITLKDTLGTAVSVPLLFLFAMWQQYLFSSMCKLREM